jgi:hypothetical protein
LRTEEIARVRPPYSGVMSATASDSAVLASP